MMTVCRLTPKRAKSLAAKLTILMDKVKDFQDAQKERLKRDEEAVKAKSVELSESGLEGEALELAVRDYRLLETENSGIEAVKEMIFIVFEKEYDFAISIVADLFGVSLDEAEDVPIEDIFDFALKDRIVRLFFPRLALLEARAQLDISAKQESFPSMPTQNI